MAAAPGDEWIDDVLPLNDMEMGMGRAAAPSAVWPSRALLWSA